MTEIVHEWAGKERVFHLKMGGVLDLEEACGKVGVGEIFLRVSTGRFFASDIWHIIRLGLIGGGENSVSAKQLLDTHFDQNPYLENAALAGEIMIAIMTGVEQSGENNTEGVEPEPFKFSEISQICRIFNMSPLDLREMRYSDFLNLVKGFNAASPQNAAPPSEEEFKEILAKHEPEALKALDDQ